MWLLFTIIQGFRPPVIYIALVPPGIALVYGLLAAEKQPLDSKTGKPVRTGNDEFLAVLQSRFTEGKLTPGTYERLRAYVRDSDYIATPGDSVVWKSTGNIFFREKSYDLALKCYGIAVELDEHNTDALNNIAMTYKMLGRDRDAQKIFDSIRTIESGRQI